MKRLPTKAAALAMVLALASVGCGGEGGQLMDTVPAETEVRQTVEEEEEGSPDTAVDVPTVELADGGELALVAGWFGDPKNNRGGFAVEGEEITSPGPTIRVPKGATVTIAFQNGHYFQDGRGFPEPHNVTVVEDKDVSVLKMEPFWGAHVGGFEDPNLEAGERGSVTFTADTAGSFYYVCAFSDHIEHGMWGRFIVVEG